jgi:hypothetical protein
MKKNVFIFSMLFAALVIPVLLNAQPVFDDDVNDVPIDGGLSLLIAAGAGYGIKKVKAQQSQKK